MKILSPWVSFNSEVYGNSHCRFMHFVARDAPQYATAKIILQPDKSWGLLIAHRGMFYNTPSFVRRGRIFSLETAKSIIDARLPKFGYTITNSDTQYKNYLILQ